MPWHRGSNNQPGDKGSATSAPLATAPTILNPILANSDHERQPLATTAAAARHYSFLLRAHLDAATLDLAVVRAVEWQVPVHWALIDLGWISERDYVRALAAEHGLAVTEHGDLAAWVVAMPPGTRASSAMSVLQVHSQGRAGYVVIATAFAPETLTAILAGHGIDLDRVMLATREEAEGLQLASLRPTMLARAASGLARMEPALSANAPTAAWQKLAVLSIVATAAAVAVFDPIAAIQIFLGLVSVPLFCVALLRLVGLAELLRRPGPTAASPPVPATAMAPDDSTLPVYSIMVALYDEAGVLPTLVKSLMALDYPASRLDILLVLEERDTATQVAARDLDLPGNFRVVVVPAGGPRTKPKALNYALHLVRGEFVVVYDAEDRPEPGQLRAALAQFGSSGADLACLQARLNIYNPSASWLTRQFTLEYTVLFDVLLPALARLRLPLPLGGTSNHFRARVLAGLGAWDPYNVTEDADLGIRLARLGFRTATLASTTWEEAPPDFGNWLRQRTRWLKGWMQTYLVHMRQPVQLAKDLGPRATVGLHVLMAGILVAVLAHPIVYLLVAIEAWSGRFPPDPHLAPGAWMGWLALANLGLGLLSSMAVAAIAIARRGRRWLAWAVLLMPAYWLIVSVAGYRALAQLVVKPYLWEKTQHGAPEAASRRDRPTVGSANRSRRQ